MKSTASRQRPWVLALVLVAALSGCGVVPTPLGSINSAATFVGASDTEAVLVQWADDGQGNLTGTLQLATPSPESAGAPLKNSSTSLTGTLHDGQVALVLKLIFGETTTWTGTLKGKVLHLDIPQTDGTVQGVDLTRGEISTYNAAIASLSAGVETARAAEASASAAAAAQAADEAAAQQQAADDQARQDAYTTAQGQTRDAITQLQETLAQPTALADSATAVSHARSHLKAVHAAADKARANAGTVDACSYASDADGADADVQGDEADLEGAQADLDSTISDVQSAIDDVKSAREALQTSASAISVTPDPAPAVITSAIKVASARIDKWRTSFGAARKTMTALVAEADRTAEQANAVSCG